MNTQLPKQSINKLLKTELANVNSPFVCLFLSKLFILLQVESLIGRIERLGRSPLHSNVGVALDRWLACIRELQNLRKDEINNSPGSHVGSYGCKSYDDRGRFFALPVSQSHTKVIKCCVLDDFLHRVICSYCNIGLLAVMDCIAFIIIIISFIKRWIRNCSCNC